MNLKSRLEGLHGEIRKLCNFLLSTSFVHEAMCLKEESALLGE